MTGPVLSNFLADLAERIGEHVGRYRRSTLTAAESALEAGRLLVEARAECRHGEWLAFLERAGLADRTARNWMRLARSELGPANIVAAGGVRAALLMLANPKAIAIVERQVDELATEAESATVADLTNPGRALAHASGLAAAESRSVQADAPPIAARRPNPAPVGPMSLYASRRARGQCTVCAAPSDKARCDGCAEALNARRRSRTRFAAELAPRIEGSTKFQGSKQPISTVERPLALQPDDGPAA